MRHWGAARELLEAKVRLDLTDFIGRIALPSSPTRPVPLALTSPDARNTKSLSMNFRGVEFIDEISSMNY